MSVMPSPNLQGKCILLMPETFNSYFWVDHGRDVSLFFRWKPERAPCKKKKSKRKRKSKNKKGRGNLGENPKGRQGGFFTTDEREKEQLMTWFVWGFSSCLWYFCQYRIPKQNIQSLEYDFRWLNLYCSLQIFFCKMYLYEPLGCSQLFVYDCLWLSTFFCMLIFAWHRK